MSERPGPVAFSPREFAALFKKEQSWGYRQIYAGKVKTITEYGRILIPASEVERILASAARYEGRKQKPAKSKAEIEALKPELQSAWQQFITKKRAASQIKAKAAGNPFPSATVDRAAVRAAALARLRRTV